MDKLFHMFGKLKRTAHQNSEGIGMGLMICKSLIEGNGGVIEVKSEGVDRGSSFIFTMKMTKEKKEWQPIYLENKDIAYDEDQAREHYTKEIDKQLKMRSNEEQLKKMEE